MSEKKFSISLDTSRFTREIDEANKAFDELARKIEQARRSQIPAPSRELPNKTREASQEASKMNDIFARSRNILAGVFATQQISSFIQQVVSVRGQFQQLEISFTTMLGSAQEAEKLMGQLTSTAAKTPFDLQGVASGAKQLLAYGFAADKVNETLIRLGDVAAGLSQPLGDIVYLYGTLKASGRVTNIDIRQFANRGIPIYEELAKVLGVTQDKINGMVSAGKVGFPHIEQAFKNLTSEGGKFANLMAEQSKSITGQISNLGDAFDSMLNDIGKSSEGIISGAISSVAFLVENYEKVGRVLVALIATYGVYKAAILTNIALTKADALAKSGATIATKAHAAAQALLNKTMLANPYVAVAAGLTALVATMWALHDSTTAEERAQREFNDAQEAAKKKADEHKRSIEGLISVATNDALATFERESALSKLRDFYPQIFDKYDTEKLKLADILDLKKQIAEADGKMREEDFQKRKAEAYNKWKKLEAEVNRFNGSYMGALGWSLLGDKKAKAEAARLEYQKYVQEELKQNDRLATSRENLAKMSDDQINSQISRIERLKYDLKKAGGKATRSLGYGGVVQGDYTLTELQTIQAQLIAHLEERNKTYKDYATQKKEALSVAKKAEKEYNDFIKLSASQLKEWSKNNGYKDPDVYRAELKTNADEALKKLEYLEDKKEKQRNDKKAKEAKKLSEDISKDRVHRARAVEDELTEIELRGAKNRLQIIELERKKALRQIEREKTDWIKNFKKNENEAEKEFAPKVHAVNTRYDEEVRRYIEEENDKYQTLAERRAEIFSKLEEALTLSSGDSERDTSIKEYFAKQLDDLDKEILQSLNLLRLYEGDGADIVKDKIKEVLPLFERLSELSIGELRKAQDAVAGLTLPDEAIKKMQELGISVASLLVALEKAKANAGKQISEEISEKLAKGIRDIGSAMDSLGNSLANLDGIVGAIGVSIADFGQSVSAFGDMARAVKEQGAIGAIPFAVSGISKVLDMIGRQQQENLQRQKEWADFIAESIHKARLMRIELASISRINIFGVKNPYQGAIDGAKQYLASVKELNETANSLSDGKVQVGTKKVVSAANIAKGAAGGAAAGAAIGSIIPGVGTLIGGVIGGIFGSIAGGLTKKVVPVFESLGKKYGSLFDSETYELNPKVKQDYAKLDDATKKIVDRWEEIRKKALDATQKMKENFKSLAGDIGDKLSEALAKGFRSGDIKGAMYQFRSSVNKIIRDIAEQKLFSSIFGDTFDKLEQRMTNSFKGKNADNDIEDDLIWFFKQTDALSDTYAKARERLEGRLKKDGIDEGADGRTATTRGIAQASQESIDTMIGQGNTQILQLDRMIAIQERMTTAIEGMQFVRLAHLSSLSYQELVAIRKLTERVESNTAGIKSIGQDIQRNGLKISR